MGHIVKPNGDIVTTQNQEELKNLYDRIQEIMAVQELTQCVHCGGYFNAERKEIRPVFVVAGQHQGFDNLCTGCEEQYKKDVNEQ
jgi:formate dehydrogenase assembly factor FdhD